MVAAAGEALVEPAVEPNAPGQLLRRQQVAERHPPRPLHREGAARHRRATEAREPAVADEVRGQDLAAPQRPVVAHPQAVVGDADERLRDAVLGRARGDVCVVMLDRDPPPGRESGHRVLGGQVLGVEVVSDDLGLQGQQPLQVRQPVGEGPVRGQVLQVAVVRRDVGPAPAGQGEGVLQLGPHRQERPLRRDRQRQRLRGVAAPAPDDRGPPRHDPADGVVVAGPDLAVVDEERVGKPGQALRRVGVVGGQRLVGEVAGRQHERPADGGQQQVVERGVGQEDAQPPVACGHGRGESRLPATAGYQQDDRPLRPGQESPLGGPHPRQPLRRGDVGHHHRERLCPAPLAVAEAADGRRVGGVAGQVVAAQALDRHDPARQQVRNGGGQRLVVAGAGSARRRSGGRPGEVRTPGTPPARRGSAGWQGRRTPRRRPRRAGRPASWCGRGRTAARR